jgi:hypothetical protein
VATTIAIITNKMFDSGFHTWLIKNKNFAGIILISGVIVKISICSKISWSP